MRKNLPQYLPHDRVITFNEEDPRLAKDSLIVYELPEPPIAEHIHNYGLPADECFWKPFKPSHKLQVLMDRGDLTDNQKIKFLEENQDYYKHEIAYIQEEHRRGEEGFWMFIGVKDGNVRKPKPFWIPPYHYDFLQTWDVGGGLPDFRMRDRKFYIFWHMVLFDKSCTGFNYPKHRREGATTKVQEIRYKLISSLSDSKSGLQSKTKKDAEEVHENLLMKPWKRLPFWKRPIWDGDERKKDEINFSAPTSKMHPDYGKKALDSKLDYRESGVFAYDSTKQELIHNDEIGKCLAAGTKLLMFDGTYKIVEDIVVGDLLMGVNSQPRKVLSLHRGEDEMYEIIPTKGEKWGCNQEHILSLKWACKSQKFRGHKKGDTVNIPVKEFIKLSGQDKRHLMQYRDGNPNHTGITVKHIGRGYYYGFSLDGDRLFLLADGTVTHNTAECDVVNRLQVQLPCVYRGGRIIGKIINTSTVAEITKQGGAAFRQICDNSHYLKKDANGRTLYGLYNLFIPADDGFELEAHDVNRICEQLGRPKENTGYPDKYGFCDKEICGTFLKNRRKAFLDNGDMDGYIEECRLYPLSWDDCWMQSASNNNFNILIINDRLNQLRTDEMRAKVIRGDFQWHENKPDTKVVFVPSERGRFYVSYLFPNPGTQANRMYIDENGVKCPDNPAFTAGADPFKFKRTSQNKKSDGAGAVYWDFDATVDNRLNPVNTWKSNRFVCTYSNRPDDKYAYAEDMLKMCVYYGCEMNSERNVDLINEHFEDRGYEGFLLNKISRVSNKLEKIPGEYASVTLIEEIFREYQYYIQRFGQNEMHPEILQQCLDIADDMGDFDLFAAGGYALLGAKRKRSISERFYTQTPEQMEQFVDDFDASDDDGLDF